MITFIRENLYLVLVIIIICLVTFTEKNLNVQEYLPNLWTNQLVLKNKFKKMINPDYSVKINNLDKPIIYIENFLNTSFFRYLVNQIPVENKKSTNVILRKASGISFTELHQSYSGFLEFYHSFEFKNFLQHRLKKIINRPPMSDDNCCSIIMYTSKGDYINWHYDYSSYHGKRYTILLTLVNENELTGNLSENNFIYVEDGVEKKLKCKPNSIIIFDGENIRHKSTPINDNEKRVLISMTFCDICQQKTNIINRFYEKIKNLAFY